MTMNNSPETRLSLIGRLHDKDDGDAWSEFVQIYEPLILTVARRRGMQHADAAEIAQEVLNRVSKSIDTWNPDPAKGSFRGWLYQVTRNMTIDFLRRNRKWRETAGGVILDDLPSPTADESKEFRLEYERQLFSWAAASVKGSFKPANWQAFWMSAVEEKPMEQVAEKLGITRGQVYVARSRIMARIATVIKQRAEDTADLS